VTCIDRADVAAATLACLPQITPARLRRLLQELGGPVAALAAVQDGHALDALERGARGTPDELAQLARLWREADPVPVARTLVRRQTSVWREPSDRYPIRDEFDDRPVLLFAEGDGIDVLDRPRVAVVGTRAATPHGLADARELGAFLAAAGVTVVSGMAIGIDGAVHEGAVAAGGGVVGVVATGLDIEYPRRHRSLYERVRARGLVIGETGFGVRPAAPRFPVRNRIIAALADIVVVVEATVKGGARITAQYGLDYDRVVMAVPGSRRNAAAAGTNALIADGAQPLLEWDDVVIALGMTAGSRRGTESRRAPGPDGATLLRALGGDAATSDQIADRTGFAPERVALTIVELERAGWVERSQGCVWPR
jgi:DNA processing protein